MDYCLNGEMRAKNYARLISAFYASKSTATSLARDRRRLHDHAAANPTGTLGDYAAGMAFTGPGRRRRHGRRDSQPAARHLLSDGQGGHHQLAMNVSGTFTYYHASWGVLSLMAMSGNFWDMTQ